MKSRRQKPASRLFIKPMYNPQAASLIIYANLESKILAKGWRLSLFLKTILSRVVQFLRHVRNKFKKLDQAQAISTTDSANLALTQVNKHLLSSPDVAHSERMSNFHLPIVFIHYGNNDYLQYSLSQAKKSNPNSTVYLLGDSSNDCYEYVKHYSMMDFFNGSQEFAKLYRHYNTNNARYELVNFQRWFILKEFLIARELDKCLYLDSDTLLFANVTDDQRKFSEYDFSISRGTCGSTFFLNRVEALEEYCQFLLNIYSQEDMYHYDWLVSHFVVRNKNGIMGGASDMTAFALYLYSHFGSVGEVTRTINGSVYDPNINKSDPGFEMQDGIKKILFKNHMPYGIHERTGKEIKFNSLHFQGKAKSLMGPIYRSAEK